MTPEELVKLSPRARLSALASELVPGLMLLAVVVAICWGPF